jgi:hypothetical protein
VVFIKWNLFSNKEKEILSFASKSDSEGQKSHCSSYVDYRPEINAVMLLDMGHTLRGESTWRNREREGNLKLECG